MKGTAIRTALATIVDETAKVELLGLAAGLPDDAFLERALGELPAMPGGAIYEDLDPIFALLSHPECLESDQHGPLSILRSTDDDGKPLFQWALGERVLFPLSAAAEGEDTAASASTSPKDLAFLLNSILHRLCAWFVHESAIRLGPAGGDIVVPRWAECGQYIRFTPQAGSLPSSPARDDPATLIHDVAHYDAARPDVLAYLTLRFNLLPDLRITHIKDGRHKWRRTDLIALHRQSDVKALALDQALSFIAPIHGSVAPGPMAITDNEEKALTRTVERVTKLRQVGHPGGIHWTLCKSASPTTAAI